MKKIIILVCLLSCSVCVAQDEAGWRTITGAEATSAKVKRLLPKSKDASFVTGKRFPLAEKCAKGLMVARTDIMLAQNSGMVFFCASEAEVTTRCYNNGVDKYDKCDYFYLNTESMDVRVIMKTLAEKKYTGPIAVWFDNLSIGNGGLSATQRMIDGVSDKSSLVHY